MARVGFVGLGVMGGPMAGHLAKGGHDVTVYNRSTAKAEAWAARHVGTVVSTPAEVGAVCEIVFTCVGNDDDVQSVVMGPDGIVHGLAAGSILVDHTTASADLARHLGLELGRRGMGFVDAPVSGGQAGAENGTLTVMCGGEQSTFDRVKPVIDCYARACTLLGVTGSGQLTKMVNQLCIAGLVQGLAEGLHLGMKAGLDMDKVLEVISKGAAGSWQMDNRGRTMVGDEFEFGFAVEWMRKDLGICLAEAHRLGARLPVAALVDQFYAAVEGRGGGRWDTSSLIHLLTHD